jgi:hypothetical protein
MYIIVYVYRHFPWAAMTPVLGDAAAAALGEVRMSLLSAVVQYCRS